MPQQAQKTLPHHSLQNLHNLIGHSTGGVTSSSLGTDDVLRGFDKFEDVDNIEVDFLIAPQSVSTSDATTVVNDLIASAECT